MSSPVGTVDAKPPVAGRRLLQGLRLLPLAIPIAVLAVLTLYPVLMLLYGSVRDAPPGAPGSLSLDGWIDAFSNPRTYSTFRTSFGLGLFATTSSVSVGCAMAWLVTRTDLPVRGFFERVMIYAVFIPAVVSAIAWSVLANPRAGVLNEAIGGLLGRDIEAINIYSFWGLVFQYTTVFAPLVFLLVLGPFKSMDGSLEEASRTCGATLGGTARRITFPLMGAAIIGSAVLVFVRVLESFEIPQILGRPAGIQVFMTRIYSATRLSVIPDYSQATVLGVIVLLTTFALVALQILYVSKRSFVTVGGKAFRPSVAPLGRWRWPVTVTVVLYLLVTVALPTIQIFLASFQRVTGLYGSDNWTLDGWRYVLGQEWFWPTVLRTIGYAAFAGFVTMVITTIVSYIVVRSRSRWGRALELLTWMPWALPGLVLALGILWGYSDLPGGVSLYGTVLIMLIAYVTIGLPLGARAMMGGLMQLSPELEEAARLHGAGRMRAFLTVVFPLVRQTFFFGFTVSFVLISREVGASLLLFAPGQEVLSIEILGAWTDGQAIVAVVLSCVLILMAALVIALERLTAKLFPSGLE